MLHHTRTFTLAGAATIAISLAFIGCGGSNDNDDDWAPASRSGEGKGGASAAGAGGAAGQGGLASGAGGTATGSGGSSAAQGGSSGNPVGSAGGAAGEPAGTGGVAGSAAGSGGDPGAGGAGGAGAAGGAGGTAGGGSGTGTTDYAPYFYTWGWGNPAYPFVSLTDLKAKSGLDAVTLAFVLSDGGCAATQDVQQHMTDVGEFRANGGRLKASFGGANGTYLENACGDAGSLDNAISAFVTSTGITDLDFDVEQWGAMTSDVNQRRAQALASVQAKHGIKVAFTLAATPKDKWGTAGGLSAGSLEVVKTALDAGVQLSHVNLMTMDYGDYFSAGNSMGDLAISVVEETKKQLQALVPGLGDADAYAMLGATPMIGQNDVASEVFTLADAQKLTSYALQNKLGLIAFWAINRDQPGSGNLGISSGVNTATFQFHDIFKAVAQ